MKILMIGDIFGKTGRRSVSQELSKLKQKYNIDFVIANAENTTHCRGLNTKHYEELSKCGIDFFTMGNHTWNKEEIYDILDTKNNIVRPHNMVPTSQYGKSGIGTQVINFKNKKIRITNLLGSSIPFRNLQENPFLSYDEILEYDDSDINIVDLHAETTSEKNAFFKYFQGRATVIVGTHTHVQTNDARITNDTAYLTDLGMTGPANGIIGAKPDTLIEKFLGHQSFFVLEDAEGQYQFNAALIEIDDKTNKPISIKPIFIFEQI